MTLDGRVVLVTGAAKGIGLAVGRAFAQRGCRAVLNSVSDETAGAQAVGEIATPEAWPSTTGPTSATPTRLSVGRRRSGRLRGRWPARTSGPCC